MHGFNLVNGSIVFTGQAVFGCQCQHFLIVLTKAMDTNHVLATQRLNNRRDTGLTMAHPRACHGPRHIQQKVYFHGWLLDGHVALFNRNRMFSRIGRHWYLECWCSCSDCSCSNDLPISITSSFCTWVFCTLGALAFRLGIVDRLNTFVDRLLWGSMWHCLPRCLLLSSHSTSKCHQLKSGLHTAHLLHPVGGLLAVHPCRRRGGCCSCSDCSNWLWSWEHRNFAVLVLIPFMIVSAMLVIFATRTISAWLEVQVVAWVACTTTWCIVISAWNARVKEPTLFTIITSGEVIALNVRVIVGASGAIAASKCVHVFAWWHLE
eukprot:m.3593 g.3593  ORF g.3593 m.3593 type:complete len:320 (-) comp4247_c0_seq1:484-1443(-)